jgi:transcriptional regulator with XRE-family HTH domain
MSISTSDAAKVVVMPGKSKDIEQGGLGAKLRALRKQRGLTLEALAELTQYSASALSKMENEQLGLTYDKLTRFVAALGVDIGSLFTDRPQIPPKAAGRRSIVRRGEGRSISTGSYDYLYLCPELSHKKIVPIIGKVRATSIEDFGTLVSHEGEEWIYVIKGTLEVHSEFYEPETLAAGDSMYIDSRMGHAYISKTRGGTDIIAVCTDPSPPELMQGNEGAAVESARVSKRLRTNLRSPRRS